MCLRREPQGEGQKKKPSPGGATGCSAGLSGPTTVHFCRPSGAGRFFFALFPGLTPRAILCRRSAAILSEKLELDKNG